MDSASLASLVLELGGERAGVALDARDTPDGPDAAKAAAAIVVRDVHQDSRLVEPGVLFVSRLGGGDVAAARARRDKHLHEAIAKGASAVMRAFDPEAPPLPVPTIGVPEERLREAIGVVASAVHGHPSFALEVLGVTGTNGKTTTTWLLGGALDELAKERAVAAALAAGAAGAAGKEGAESAAAAALPDCAVIGTVEARLGLDHRVTTHTTPEGDELARLIAWARDRGAKHVALEVSSHALEQARLSGTRVRVAAFTNLTQDHLDFHGTMEAYFEAKAKLFDQLEPGASVVCVDDDWGAMLAARVRGPLLRVSARGDADAEISPVTAECDARGIRATVATPKGNVLLESRLLGAHNLQNLLVALGVLIAIDVDPADAARALGRAPAVPGRLELASSPDDEVLVLVDYAHTPDALARVLSTLRGVVGAGRLVCVFGCGGDRDPTKRAPMGQAVAAGADLAFVTSDNPRTEDPRAIVDAVLVGLEGVRRLAADELSDAARGCFVEIDRAAAIALAIETARPGDVVLIAGKGHEDYQIVGTEKRHFDDVEEAWKALAARRADAAERPDASGEEGGA
jgi:UDP-N-acetylmuramoyl-L-alanyl-D-glutamate--2,6-diaminopimelate ligase